MNDPSQLAALVERTAGAMRRRRVLHILGWSLAALPLAALAGVVIDAALSPGPWPRLVLALLMVGGPLSALIALCCWSGRLTPGAEEARREAERAAHDEQRALTATLELSAMPGVLAQAGALRLAGAVDTAGLLSGLPRGAPTGALCAGGAALAIAACLQLVLPELLAMVLPRLFDPFGDHPPYSATRLQWQDPPHSARPGEAPRLSVRTSGPQARELWLVGSIPGLPGEVRVPMVQETPERWAVTLAPLPAPPRAEGMAAVLWAEGAGTRTTRLRLRLDPVPQLRECVLRLSAPAYARLDDLIAKVAGGAAVIQPLHWAALPGSRLEFQPTANRALAAVWLARDHAPAVRQQLSAGRLLLADPGPGHYELMLEAEDGVRGDPLPLLELARRIDQPPEVSITQPPTDGIATPDATVPLVIEAVDDLGLAALTWQLLVDGKVREQHVEVLGGTGDAFRGSLRLKDVAPGQEVRVVAVARDTMPPAGQLSAPAVRTLTIISGSQWNELVLDQLSEQALLGKYAPLLARLAELERQSAQAASAPAAPDAHAKRMQELADATRQLGQEVAGLARPDPLFAVEPDLQRAIEGRISELEREQREGKPADGAQENAEQLRGDLEELTARAETDALAARLEELASAQEGIAKELGDLAARKGPSSDADRARLRDLAERQQQLNQVLKEWSELAEEAAKRLAPRDAERAEQLAGQCRTLNEKGAAKLGEETAHQARSGHAPGAEPPAAQEAAILRALAGRSPSGGACRSGWCSGDGMGRCQSLLARLARLGMGRGGSPSSSGSSGATGAFGGGTLVRPGGRPSAATMPLYGPEPLASLPGGRTGGNGTNGGGAAVVRGTDGSLHPATPYAAGTRTSVAGIGVPLGPGEQRLVDDYYRRLDGDALAPPVASSPARPPAPAPPPAPSAASAAEVPP
jgi:hypothetical protein